MANLNMKGPYDLTNEEVDNHVRVNSIGNYAYGYISGGSFIVKYVGRSDDDLNARAKHGVGQYEKFKFSYALTKKSAYEKECRNWHDFGGPDGKLDNVRHPDKPDFTDYKCPVCGQ